MSTTAVQPPLHPANDRGREPGLSLVTQEGSERRAAAAAHDEYLSTFADEPGRTLQACKICNRGPILGTQRLILEFGVTALAGIVIFALLGAIALESTPDGTGLDCEVDEHPIRDDIAQQLLGSLNRPVLASTGLAVLGWVLCIVLVEASGLQLCCLSSCVVRSLQISWRRSGNFEAIRAAGLSVSDAALSGFRLSCAPVTLCGAIHIAGLITLATAIQLTTGSVRLGSIANSERLGSAFLNATAGRAMAGAIDPACSLVPWILDKAATGSLYAGPSTSTRLSVPDLGSVRVSMRAVLQPVSTVQSYGGSGFLPAGVTQGLAVVALWVVTDTVKLTPGESLGCAGVNEVPVTMCVGSGRERDPDLPCPGGPIQVGLVPLCGSLYRGYALPSGNDPWLPGAGTLAVGTLRDKVVSDSRADGLVIVDGVAMLVGNSRGVPGALRLSWAIFGRARHVGLWLLVTGAVLVVLLRASWLWIILANHYNHTISEPATTKIPSLQRHFCGIASSPSTTTNTMADTRSISVTGTSRAPQPTVPERQPVRRSSSSDDGGNELETATSTGPRVRRRAPDEAV